MNRREIEMYCIGGVMLDAAWLPKLRASGVTTDGFEDLKLASVWTALCRLIDRDDVVPTLDAVLAEVLREGASEDEEGQWRALLMLLDETVPPTANPKRWAKAFRRHAGKAKAEGWLR